jgi:hypothetical protein
MTGPKRERWTEHDVAALPKGEHDYFDRKSGALLDSADFRKDLFGVGNWELVVIPARFSAPCQSPLPEGIRFALLLDLFLHPLLELLRGLDGDESPHPVMA